MGSLMPLAQVGVLCSLYLLLFYLLGSQLGHCYFNLVVIFTRRPCLLRQEIQRSIRVVSLSQPLDQPCTLTKLFGGV